MSEYSSRFPNDTPTVDRLYHYTSAYGLHGILGEKKIRATSLAFVNDSQELLLGISLAKKLLQEQAKNCPIEREAQQLSNLADRIDPQLLAKDPDLNAGVTICSFSLSENGDQLSQWRGYCPHHGGYALGFSSEELKRFLDKDHNWRLIRCRYLMSEQQSLIARLVDWVHEMFRRGEPNIIEIFWRALLPYAAAIKNENFVEEKEWRVVSTKRANSRLKVRPAEGLLVPYDEIDFNNATAILNRIQIGPQAHQETALVGVVAGLGGAGIRADVEKSSIPYRSMR